MANKVSERSVTTHNVLKKLRTKTMPVLRKFGITHSTKFAFKNTNKPNEIFCFVDNTQISSSTIETQIINYGKLLEEHFGIPFDYDSIDKKISIGNVNIDFQLQTEREFPGNFLQPNYFNISGNTIKYSNYISVLTNLIESDNLMVAHEKDYLKKILSNTSHSVSAAPSKFDKQFIKKVAVNFSEIIAPLFFANELLNQEIIESNNNLSIKFPSSQNYKYDYEITVDNAKWLVSVKGGTSASISALSGKVNTIKFNTIFNNSREIDTKNYGIIQSIVAKNIMNNDRIDGPIKAVVEILNLNANKRKVAEVENGLFVATKNKFMTSKQRKYIVDYIKGLTKYNKKELINDEAIVEFLKNVKKSHVGTYEELAFVCERALTLQSGSSSRNNEKNSNYKKFVYDYLKENNVIIQQIAVNNTTLKIISEVKTFDTLREWYYLRSKNSPGHMKDKIGIDPIGR